MYTELTAYIEGHNSTPFQWGVHDCCHFVAGAMMAMHGVDLMAAYRGGYNDKKSALALLKKHGPASLFETIKTMFDEVHISAAGRGDLVYRIDRKNGASLGVCIGADSVFVGETGNVLYNTLDCARGFKWVKQ